MAARDLLAGQNRDRTLNHRLKEIESRVNSVRTAGFSAQRLSDVSPNLGVIESGEFRVGNGVTPGNGFTGGRMAWPGISFSGSNFFLVGVQNDTFQVGLSIDKGVFIGGSQNALGQPKIRIDNQGIKLTSDDVPSLRWIDSASNASHVSTGIWSIDGAGDYNFYIQTNYDKSARMGNQYYRAVADNGAGGCYIELQIEASAPAVGNGRFILTAVPTNYLAGLEVQGAGSYLNDLSASGILNVSQALTVGSSRVTTQASAFFNIAQGGNLVISTASITAKGSRHRVDTSGAAINDLEFIGGMNDGDIIILQTVNNARDILLKHNATNGNMILNNGANRTLNNTNDMFVGIYNADTSKVTEWGKN